MARSAAPSLDPQQLVTIYRQALQKGISLDSLEERIAHKLDRAEVSKTIEKHEEKVRVTEMRKGLPRFVRWGAMIVPIVFIGVGLLLVGNATLPIAQYYTNSLKDIRTTALIPPIPREEVLDVTPYVIAQTTTLGAYSSGRALQDGPIILDTELDFTNLSNWFADEQVSQLAAQDSTEYTLNIPKIEIENAVVKIGGTDLNKSLIAYPGTALPGESGAPVIFGHSVLRQFYNPSDKNPRRYNSIFSYIMTLQPGDPIFVSHAGATYKYVVRDKTEVKPEDTYILAQQFDSKKLRLVTCVPEGTYLRRGVITAELVAI
jgi:LPXTG-site transpeptidase (sortase) family protein